MCLAVPGRIVSIRNNGTIEASGVVDFQGTTVEVGLAMVPEAVQGDWVLVHAGFAISRLDEAEARETWQYLEEAGLAEDTAMEDEPPPPGAK
jgi:hydrogenase expression/formation protein HypC